MKVDLGSRRESSEGCIADSKKVVELLQDAGRGGQVEGKWRKQKSNYLYTTTNVETKLTASGT